MGKLIEDFSRRMEMVNPENGHQYTAFVELKVEKWNQYDELVASTFNSYEKAFQMVFAEALEKYKKLRYVSGVTGGTMNDIMQSNVIQGMKERFGDRIEIDTHGGGRFFSTTFELKEAAQ